MLYWDSKGKYQTEYDLLFKELVPMSGKCESLAGELVRAATRIYYDAYNNGFCNNTSGAWNFLFGNMPRDRVAFMEALEVIKPRVNTGGYSDFESEKVQNALDTMVDNVLEYIDEYPSTKSMPPNCDMFDLQEEDVWDEYDEDEEDCPWA